MRDEFYTFQVGVFSPLAATRVLPRWGPLTGPRGATIDHWRLRCINVPNGSAQATSGLPIGAGGVQSLWFGVDVAADARAKGHKAHRGNVFGICVEKGSELPLGHPERKYKGRYVYQGNQVRDEYNEAALFNELGSSPATLEGAKAVDV